MNDTLHRALQYVKHNKQTVGTSVIALIGVVVLVCLFIYNQPKGPDIVYRPTKACSLLTPKEALDVLGERISQTTRNEPVIEGNLATSKCSYTDKNPNKDKMVSIGIAVRSAINDAGAMENKSDFQTRHKNTLHGETVKNLGDEAYYDPANHLLHILDGKRWIMINYSTGENLDPKPVKAIVALAHQIL